MSREHPGRHPKPKSQVHCHRNSGAGAFKHDLPDAEIHLNGGHFALDERNHDIVNSYPDEERPIMVMRQRLST